MKYIFKYYLIPIILLFFASCTTNSAVSYNTELPSTKHIKYLALGDSYTIG